MGWFGKKEKPQEATAGTAEKPAVAAAEEFAVMPQELRVGIARLKGRPASNEPVKAPMAEVFPLSAAALQEERAKEAARQKAEEEARKNFQVGKMVPDKGIFMGIWAPKDRDGKSLGKTFNLFAAPQDITDRSNLATFNDAVQRVAKLKNWNGHDGANLANDTAIYDALKNGSYNGQWFIPTKDIVHGKDIDGKHTGMKGIYQLREEGDFKGTLITTSSGSGYGHWYWSSTERRDDADHVYVVGFTDGDDGWDRKDTLRLSCRPVRAELRP